MLSLCQHIHLETPGATARVSCYETALAAGEATRAARSSAIGETFIAGQSQPQLLARHLKQQGPQPLTRKSSCVGQIGRLKEDDERTRFKRTRTKLLRKSIGNSDFRCTLRGPGGAQPLVQPPARFLKATLGCMNRGSMPNLSSGCSEGCSMPNTTSSAEGMG